MTLEENDLLHTFGINREHSENPSCMHANFVYKMFKPKESLGKNGKDPTRESYKNVH